MLRPPSRRRWRLQAWHAAPPPEDAHSLVWLRIRRRIAEPSVRSLVRLSRRAERSNPRRANRRRTAPDPPAWPTGLERRMKRWLLRPMRQIPPRCCAGVADCAATADSVAPDVRLDR